MARRGNGFLLLVFLGPGAVGVSTMALWENEGRFDYYLAAAETTVIESPEEAGPEDVVSLTAALDTTIPIRGDYVESFTGYLFVRRYAEIYSWSEDEDDDGSTTWSEGWYSTLESNSRNSEISQVLSSGRLYPPRYRLGELEVSTEGIHLVDANELVVADNLPLSELGQRYGLERSNEYLHLRQSPDETTLGDERVQYVGIPASAQATYFGAIDDGIGIGRQFELNEGLVSALIQNDGVLHHLANGDRDAALDSVRFDFMLTKWLVRVLGSLGMIVGFWFLFSRFASVLYSLPWLRGLVRIGVVILGVAVGLPLALIVIASSMAIHSPLTAALPMAVGIAGAIYLMRRSGVTRAHAQWRRDKRLAERREERQDDGDAFSLLDEDERDVRLAEMEIEETFARLAALAHVEGGLDKGEVRFLRRWGKRNGVTREQMDELSSKAKKDDPRAKDRDDLELLVYMALADGVLSAGEYTALEGVGRKLGVGESELETIIASVEAAPVPG